MQDTYLIQRLNRPYVRKDTTSKLLNAFAFGGGYKNGGLSDDAMKLIGEICSFDYMGAAEFEYGALPEALGYLAKAATDSKLGLWSVLAGELPLRKVTTDTRAIMSPTYHWDDILADEEIYVIGPLEHRDEINQRLCELAQCDCTVVTKTWMEHGKSYARGLKEYTYLARALKDRMNEAEDRRTLGWIELDNGFIFSVDQDMILKFAELFGIEPARRFGSFAQQPQEQHV